MKNKTVKPRVYVEVTASWGNDDADSTIKVSRRRWEAICAGAEYSVSTWSWYEGMRFRVSWSFANGKVSIFGEDGMVCKLDYPVDELFIRITNSD